MGLFGRKKKEEKASAPCCCGGSKGGTAADSYSGLNIDNISSVKVLGAGCKACHELYDNTQKAVEGKGIEVEYITDLQKIMEYGTMSLPALVVNEKLVSYGKVLKPQEIVKLLAL